MRPRRIGYLREVNKRPGHVTVTIETGYCSFCDRTRNLRREERQLGTLIRTVIACESCHRLLSSTMGVASADTPSTEATPAQGAPAQAEVEAAAAPVKRAAAPKVKAAAAKPKAAGVKSKAPANRNPRSK
jgi:hypothetical protein